MGQLPAGGVDSRPVRSWGMLVKMLRTSATHAADTILANGQAACHRISTSP